MGQNRRKSPKNAAKVSFGLLWLGLLRQFHPPTLHCHNSSIAAVIENATINAPFSGVSGFLRRVENRRHMLSKFVSIDF